SLVDCEQAQGQHCADSAMERIAQLKGASNRARASDLAARLGCDEVA
ncbi:MAG: hypothetical protein ACI8W7_005067, partial [Gammaproteobacteria bacterium]